MAVVAAAVRVARCTVAIFPPKCYNFGLLFFANVQHFWASFPPKLLKFSAVILMFGVFEELFGYLWRKSLAALTAVL